MAVPTKLSYKLRETLGEEAAGEMVDWMNRVDAQRAELRDLNELNFARIEARFAQVNEQMHSRFERVEERLDGLEKGLGAVDARVGRLETEMRDGFKRIEVKLADTQAHVIKWCFVFWVGSVITMVGALAALGRFFTP